MINLNDICNSMYRQKDEYEMVLECFYNEDNQKLDSRVLEQIQSKCGNLMPLMSARACGAELGLNVPEPGSQKEQQKQKPMEPGVTSISGTPQFDTTKCAQKCGMDFEPLENKWEKCVRGCYSGEFENDIKISDTVEDIKDEIAKRREERANMTIWGKFAFKVGPDFRWSRSVYNDAFKKWNAKHPSSDHSDAGVIDKGWRAGLRLALTTEPWFTRGTPWFTTPDSLVKVTLADISIYDNQYMDSVADPGGDREISQLYSTDNFKLTVADMTILNPFLEYNFWEFGVTAFKNDLLWGTLEVGKLKFALDWQFQGQPLKQSTRFLDVKDVAYMLSSYTMISVGASGVAVLDVGNEDKASEFCNQVSDNCAEPAGEAYPSVDNAFFLHHSGDEATPGEGEISFSKGMLEFQIFGEQSKRYGAMAYRTYFDYYPTWKKIESGGSLGLHLYLGKAMQIFAEGDARKLWSLREKEGEGKDIDILLPDDGVEFGVFVGLGLRPSAIF